MKTSKKKALIIISVIAIVSILNFFIPVIYSNQKYLILLGLVLTILYFMLGINIKRNSNDIKIMRNILIYVISYYLIIYILGLFTGFVRTIYAYKFSNLFMNIVPSILSIIAVEIIRNQLIQKTNKDKLILILSCIVFILFDVSIAFNAYNFQIKDDIYAFVGLVLLTSITKNILMTTINTKTDPIPAIIYRMSLETLTYMLLIEPDLGPYLKSVVLIILPILVCMMLLNMSKKIKDTPEKYMKNRKLYWILVIILVLLVLLNSGLLKYQFMVIGSNSMKNYMEKGDLVFVERLKNNDKNKVKLSEILVYKYDGKIITHRVIKTFKRGNNTYYRTKGDNNDQADGIMISKEQVIGKVLFRVKYLGLPSVWLSDLFD